MSSSRILQVLARRGFSTSVLRAKDEVHPGYPQFWAKQKHFQKEDGKPIHLKGSGFDGILYRFTMGLCVLALGCNFTLYYNLATKQ